MHEAKAFIRDKDNYYGYFTAFKRAILQLVDNCFPA